VTVAELQAKSTPAEQADVSAIQATAAAEERTPPHGRPATTVPRAGWGQGITDRAGHGQPATTTELVKYEDVSVERATTNRLARTIVLTLVAMLACGAVTTVATIGGGRPHRLSPSVPVVQPAVTGGSALVRPDIMIDQLATGALGRISADPPGNATSPGGTNGQGQLAAREAAEEVVTQFYGALPLHKEEAYQLLGPTMRGNTLGEFTAGWLGTRSVEARVLRSDEQDGGLLRVTVSIEQFDGSVLQLLQRVEVRSVPVDGGSPQPRIVGAQLLSAHRG
jgi:hypothetical protein